MAVQTELGEKVSVVVFDSQQQQKRKGDRWVFSVPHFFFSSFPFLLMAKPVAPAVQQSPWDRKADALFTQQPIADIRKTLHKTQ